jgi:hypothetical protein
MTWVDVWKLAAIVLTAVLGAIGLLADLKNKHTRKVTRWGWATLAGIGISGAFGVASQWKDTSEAQKQRDENAALTLRLTTQTAASLANIERLLAPIDRPGIRLSLRVHCDQRKFAAFCVAAIGHEDRPEEAWKHWPGKLDQLFPPRLLFYMDAESVKHDKPSLIYQLRRSQISTSAIGIDSIFPQKEGVIDVLLTIHADQLDIPLNDGNFRSFLDFPGHVLEMSLPYGDLKDLPVENLTFISSTGQSVMVPGEQMRVESTPLATVYYYVFAKKGK